MVSKSTPSVADTASTLNHISARVALLLCLNMALCLAAYSQTTYHFHKESAGTGYDLLSTAGPDAAATTLNTNSLVSQTGNIWIANWASAVGVPNVAGVVPVNSTFQFSLWMRKTANWGTIYPAVQFGKINSNQQQTVWATAVSTTALTTTLTQITFSFTLPNSEALVATDRWWIGVGVNIPTGGSPTHSVAALFTFEGTLNGNYDSTALLPPILVSTSVSPSSPTLPMGLATQLSATGNFSDGSTQDFTKTATWSSSQTAVATVGSTGVATSVAQGAATITATVYGVSGSTTLNVAAPSLLTIAVTPARPLLPPGATQQMTATAGYSNGISQDVTSTASWSSSASAVATVSSTGIVTAAGPGTATISATVSGLSFLATITVTSPGPPAISASISPAPNAAGWNNTAVTVTFTCTPGGATIVSCPSAQVVSSEGANQVVTGTVTDSAANTASTSVTFNIDETPPALTVSSPADGSTISTSPATVAGTLSDGLSGLASLSVNGTAISPAGSFSFSVFPHPGVNLVSVRATDNAGNVALTSLHVTYPVYPLPTSILITPTNVNLTVGGTQQFTATDDQGYPRPDATWALSPPTTLATIGSGSSPVLTASGLGQVTLVATVQGISTQTTVNIVSAVGNSNWSVPPLSGLSGGITSFGHFAPAVPSDGPAALYSVEASSGGSSTAIRGLTMDGQQLWQQSLSSMPVRAPDLGGGVFIGGNAYGGVTDLDGQTGSPLWGTSVLAGNLTVRSDGSAVGFNSQGIFAINGSTGQSTVTPLGEISTNVVTYTGCSAPTVSANQTGPQASPIVTADMDGNAYFEYSVYTSSETVAEQLASDGSCAVVSDSRVATYKLVLVTILPNGGISKSQLATRTYTSVGGSSGTSGSGSFLLPGSVTPDGQGGVLATWNDMLSLAPSAYMVSHVTTAGQSDFRLFALDNMSTFGPVNSVPGTVVLDGNGIGYVNSSTGSNVPSTVVAFDTNSGQESWAVQAGIAVGQMFAQDGGGLVVQGVDTSNNPKVLAIDSLGNVGSAVATNQLLTDTWGGGWFSAGPGGISSATLQFVVDPASPWPETYGNPSQSLFGAPGCPCLNQTALIKPAPQIRPRSSLIRAALRPRSERLRETSMLLFQPPANCPICTIPQPPPTTCLPPMPGSGSVYLILVGDPGLDGHNLGFLFDLAAQQEANDLNAAGNEVIACRISSVNDFHTQLTGNGLITGGVIYFGHSGIGAPANNQAFTVASLFPGQSTLAGSNIDFTNVNQLCDPTAGCNINNYLGASATIMLIGCRGAADIFDHYANYETSIAKLIAKQLARPVYAWKVGMYASNQDRYHDQLFVATKQTPKPSPSLPMYFVPAGRPGHKPGPLLCQPGGACNSPGPSPY